MRLSKKSSIIERLLPYYRLLLDVKWHFIGALFFSVLYGVSSGFGMPYMAHKIFPKIFGPELPSDKVLLSAVLFLPDCLSYSWDERFYEYLSRELRGA